MKCEGKELQALVSLCSCDASADACSKEPRAASELNFSSTTAFECDDKDMDPELQMNLDIENLTTEDVHDVDFELDVDDLKVSKNL